MKRFVLFFVCATLLSSCHQSKSDIVKDYFEAINSYDTEKLNQLLTDNFMYCGNDTINKTGFISNMDYTKNIGQKIIILKMQDLDSVVKTEEKITTFVDSLLEVKPNIIRKRTYIFSDCKIKSIILDTALYYDEYVKAFNEKIVPLNFYVLNQYNIKNDDKAFVENIKKYVTEYVSLPASERKKYSSYAYLQGTYESDDCVFYKKLIFKGKRTVTIIDGLFGLPFATSYEIDENLIKIKTDKSDLLFEMQDEKTLIGEGFAKGTFKKTN